MIFEFDPVHPSPYKLKQLIEILEDEQVIAIPTDTCYALACLPNKKAAVARLVHMRQLDPKKPRALMFTDVKQVSEYTLLGDQEYRILRRFLPGPYCFILESNRKLPRFLGDKRQRVGVRIPAYEMVRTLIRELGVPLTVASAVNPEDNMMLYDPWSIESTYGPALATVVDAGEVPGEVSSVIDLTNHTVEVIREGRGDISSFLS